MVGRSRACQEISADCYGVVNARKNGMLGFCIKLISLLLVLGCSTCCHCFHIHCTTLFQAISALASKFNWRSNFSQLHSLLHCTLSSKPPGLPSALFWDHGTIQLGKEPSAYWSNHLVLLVSILWTSSWWNHRQYCLILWLIMWVYTQPFPGFKKVDLIQCNYFAFFFQQAHQTQERLKSDHRNQ